MSKRFSKEPEKFGTGHPEGPDRGRRQQQCQPRLGLGAVAAVRHSRRHHHRHRHRRALHEGAQSRPDAVHRARVEHVRALHHLHHGQHHHDPARHRHDPRGEPGAARAARVDHAGDRAAVRGRRLRHRQQPVRGASRSPPSASSASSWSATAIRSRPWCSASSWAPWSSRASSPRSSSPTAASCRSSAGPVAAVLAAMTIAALLWPVGVWMWRLVRRPVVTARS